MPRKSLAKKKTKLTDAERHKRFVETARDIEADERPEAFDKAFKRVVLPKRNADSPYSRRKV